MATGIPGLDVIEGYPIDPSPEAAQARKAAQQRASLRAPGSLGPQPAAPMAPVAPTAPTTASRIGGALRGGAGMLKAAAIPAAAVYAKNAIGNGLVDNRPSGPAGPQTGAAGMIPTAPDGFYPSIPQQPGNWFRDTELGRNIGNSVNAVSGGAGAATLRGVGLIPQGAARVAEALGTGARAVTLDNMGAPTQRLVQPSIRTMAAPGQGQELPQQPDFEPAGFQLPHNPYAAAPQLRQAGADTDQAQQPAAPTATHQEVMDAAKKLDEMRGHSPGMSGIRDSATEARNANWGKDRMQYLMEQALKQGGRRGAEQAQAIAAAYAAGENPQSNERIASMREGGANQRAQLQAGVLRDNAQLGAETLRRGQDLHLQGEGIKADATLAAARQKALQDTRKEGLDREKFEFDKAKYGDEQARVMQERRQSAAKAFRERSGAMFRDSDGKVDEARVGDFETHVEDTRGALIEQLSASKDPADQKLAKQLDAEGISALGAKELSQLKSLYDFKQRQRKESGMMPGSSSYTESTNLLDYMPKDIVKGATQDRLRNNAGEIGVGDLKYTTPTRWWKPEFMQTPSTAYEPALREARRLNPALDKKLREEGR